MKFFKKMFKGNTLYYPGCLTKFALKNIQEKYQKILREHDIDFIMLKDKEICCGSPVKNAGAKKDFEEIAKKNLEIFKKHGVDRIITNCPACACVFKKDYKKVLGEQWNVEVRHITEIIDEKKIKSQKKSLQPTTYKLQAIIYHDPCHLGRYLNIYNQPRDIIKACGYQIKEMELNRNESYCCGGGGGVKTNAPKLSNKIAEDRIEQAKETKSEVLITTCPMCYLNLKNNSNQKEIKVKELSELI